MIQIKIFVDKTGPLQERINAFIAKDNVSYVDIKYRPEGAAYLNDEVMLVYDDLSIDGNKADSQNDVF